MAVDAPLDRSYWAVPGKLLAGELPEASDLDETRLRLVAMLQCGVLSFIDLTEPHESGYDSVLASVATGMGVEFRYKRFPIKDMEIPTISLMTQILDTIDASIEEDMPVYVHCLMGIGRTGTVVGCYLVRHGLATGDDVLGKLAELRRRDPGSYIRSPVTEGQCAFVRSWQRNR